jgi:hypothetical protein
MEDESRNGSITIRASRRWLLLFAVLTLVPWCFFLVLNPPEWVKRCVFCADSPVSGTSCLITPKKGPWGDLRIVRIVTEPPEESLAGYLLYPRPTWLFKGYSKSDFEQLLLSAGLTPAQKTEFERAAVWSTPAEGCRVSPPDDFALSLSPESRAVIYGALSLFPENTFQNEPFRFRSDMAGEWFANSGIAEPTLARVRKLTYKRGKTLLFSDPHLVLPALPSDLERVKLLKTLSRQSTLMVQLHVSPETDIASLVSYWAARQGRAKDIKPLLESAARIPGGINIDIAHLLPRFARKRIYTYPKTDGDSGEMVFDCHWNSMNFWNDPPDDRYSNNAYVIRTLESDYEPVLDAFRFGDIILFMKSDTQAIHSAVYIADNIVFTKNGPSQHSPWILMQMETLVSHYETNTDIKVRGYRKKLQM